MLPLISLSVPVYGTESTLPALLDSILEQQPLPANAAERGALPIEILIVNDGSPGGSSLPKILQPYKKKFKSLGVPLTLLQHRKNQGLFEARRTAALAAQGEWVCCIDSDDTLPPDALLNFYEGLLASGSGNLDNAADIVHGKMAVTLHGSDKIAPEAYRRFEQKAKIVRLIFNGHLSGDEILDNFLI